MFNISNSNNKEVKSLKCFKNVDMYFLAKNKSITVSLKICSLLKILNRMTKKNNEQKLP